MIRSILLVAVLSLASLPSQAQTFEDLIVFVGEKIDVSSFDPDIGPNEILMDGAFKATYRVLRVLKGSFAEPTITFEAYDHYGIPDFSYFDHVLLFVVRSGDKYYHLKYQYFPVYATANGDWASCGPSDGLEPQPIVFSPEVSFDAGGLSRKEVREAFPEPSFAMRDGRAYCLRGNSPQDLMLSKLRSPLTEIDRSNVWLRSPF